MLKTILVPLDGSPAAEAVLPYVELLASRTGAEVKLLTVTDEDATASDYLDDVAAELTSRSLACSARTVSGGEAEAILDEADAISADLIAMSTHGRSGVVRWILGSVASKVLHGSARPLLLVRARDSREDAAPAIERILVPLDGSQTSLAVLPYVEELAAALGARLVLLNVVPPLDLYPGVGTGAAQLGSLMEDLHKQAQAFLDQVAAEIEGRGGASAQTVVTTGFPIDEVSRVGRDVDARLIAMATHGRSGVDRWVVGSVADGVVRRSPLPCLLIRPDRTPPAV